MLYLFWCLLFCFILIFSIHIIILSCNFIKIKNNKFICIFFFIFLGVFCYLTYIYVGEFKLLSLYYSKQMVESRLKQKDLRVLLIKYNKQLFKLKYCVIRNSKCGKNWYSLGKLYEIQQNYFLAMNSFYKAYKLEKTNKNYLFSYLVNRAIVTKGHVDTKTEFLIDDALVLDCKNMFVLSLLNIDNLIKK